MKRLRFRALDHVQAFSGGNNERLDHVMERKKTVRTEAEKKTSKESEEKRPKKKVKICKEKKKKKKEKKSRTFPRIRLHTTNTQRERERLSVQREKKDEREHQQQTNDDERTAANRGGEVRGGVERAESGRVREGALLFFLLRNSSS